MCTKYYIEAVDYKKLRVETFTGTDSITSQVISMLVSY
uniref:Uncharacterized protein n=1 Tax=Arundo donax TaxID=35708 RepID=A0A0A9H935_ARUDO